MPGSHRHVSCRKPHSVLNVLLLNAYAANHAERLRQALTTPWVVHTVREEEAGAKLEAALRDADALVSTRYGSTLPPAPKLKLIQIPVAGHDRLDPVTIPPDCVVCNVHEHETGISEYVMLAMLDWNVRLSHLDASFRAGDWTGGVAVAGHTHGELSGKKLGIIGFGRIGQALARRAKAFDMRVSAVTRASRPSAQPLDELAAMEHLDTLMAQSDFIVVTCPLNEETRGLIDARRLRLCKPSAVIVNVARAQVIEEEALYKALHGRVIAGAVLDVWYSYPTPADQAARPSRFPFHELPNLIMTPHCSAWTDGLIERRWRFIAGNLDRFARNEELRNVVIRPKAAAQ
ncbi:Phosphoglycerate dehydrogenase [Rhizobiales bacterium GAS113]|nr:Phosphoglycerate dehydrogenase [Rhizobiales bacterium GAS113]